MASISFNEFVDGCGCGYDLVGQVSLDSLDDVELSGEFNSLGSGSSVHIVRIVTREWCSGGAHGEGSLIG